VYKVLEIELKNYIFFDELPLYSYCKNMNNYFIDSDQFSDTNTGIYLNFYINYKYIFTVQLVKHTKGTSFLFQYTNE
jgi:hypothetical protein